MPQRKPKELKHGTFSKEKKNTNKQEKQKHLEANHVIRFTKFFFFFHLKNKQFILYISDSLFLKEREIRKEEEEEEKGHKNTSRTHYFVGIRVPGLKKSIKIEPA